MFGHIREFGNLYLYVRITNVVYYRVADLFQLYYRLITDFHDEHGRPMVVVKGNIRRKTNQGNSKQYKPMNFKIRLACEVKAIQKLLDTLPTVGCKYCTEATPAKSVGEDKNCMCLHLFLHQKDVVKSRYTDKVWFVRQKWSDGKIDKITTTLCKKAGTDKVYTNGSIRPTNITNLTMTGYSSDQLAYSFNLQQNYG